MSYVIITDTGCDIKPELLKEWGVYAQSLSFRFTDEEKSYTEADMPISEFYQNMRSGRVAKTAAVNALQFQNAFEEVLKDGNDILYIGFSSGLSSTYNAGVLAAKELIGKYPERKIITVDSLAASAGQGLIVYLAVKKKNEGASIEEVEEYVKYLVPKLAHWFTVDDLVYLKRGGRVSAASAFFGNLLGIKPVLHVDDEGHLVPVNKVRGRRTSLMALVDAYGKYRDENDDGTIFISCADCYDEANFVASEIKNKYGADVQLITDVGAVIGSHAGPGTMALFFVATKK